MFMAGSMGGAAIPSWGHAHLGLDSSLPAQLPSYIGEEDISGTDSSLPIGHKMCTTFSSLLKKGVLMLSKLHTVWKK